MRIMVLLSLVLLIAGCKAKTFDVSEGESRLVKAEYRTILSLERAVIGSDGQPVLDDRRKPVSSVSVCAEPSPDALKSTILTLAGKISQDSVDALLDATYMRSESPEYVGLRTQTIQLLRDAYFRLCEAFMNDGIDAVAYDVLQRRFQSQIVALLAVEQLTGAVTPGRRGAAANPPTQLARITDALEESEDALHDLLQEREKVKSQLSGREDKDKATIEVANQALATINQQIQRRQLVIRVLKNSFVKATQTTSNRDAVESAGDSIAGPSRSVASDVADAVRAITLNAINQDYESQVCFETLRYHNHLGQFRNDINNAFDSGGFPTDLAEGVFLDHCRSLFASQADFRNARVIAMEAVASAVEQITHKIGNGNFSADDAATYIRALAVLVPTEPGVAFLPHDRKRESVLPPGGNVAVRVGIELNASEDDGAVANPNSNGNAEAQ